MDTDLNCRGCFEIVCHPVAVEAPLVGFGYYFEEGSLTLIREGSFRRDTPPCYCSVFFARLPSQVARDQDVLAKVQAVGAEDYLSTLRPEKVIFIEDED